MRIEIKNGRLYSPANKLDGKQDLFISDGKIAGIKKKPNGFKSDLTIDASDKLVLPGLIDLCARMREPGFTYKATFKSELHAANKSGITSVCYPPDTNPVIDTTAVVDLIHQRMHDIDRANIFPLAALTQGLHGEHLAEMNTLKQAGCIGVSNSYSPVNNTEVLRRAFEYARSCDLTVFFYADDAALRNNGVAHEGPLSTRMGLPAIPETAETVAVSKALLLAEQTQTKLHFCRISTARSVKLIKDAQKQGLSVTADVGICNLHLTEIDIADFNSTCHLQPPLRSERDRQGLIKGINDGVITAICSDHQPHDSDAKSAPFSLTEPGASTIEYFLPLILHLVNRKELKLEQAITSVSSNAAKVLGIDRGDIATGKVADLCIVDQNASVNVDKEALLSAGKNTPFTGWDLPGLVTHTLYNGKLVYHQD